MGAWTPIFGGIELARGSADRAEPRRQEVAALRIDLRAPGIEFFTTPRNDDPRSETTSETTSEFREHYGLQVAINANFFVPCCTPGGKDLLGLAISRGIMVSPPEQYNSGSKALLITRDNHARLVSLEKPVSFKGVWTAIAGSDLVLVAGATPKPAPPNYTTVIGPRTAVGISQDGRYLILMTIDGRQSGYSEGATLAEEADWLARFGAFEGLNLDGGGSTTMVREEGGRTVVLNRPSGVAMGSSDNAGKSGAERTQRSNGNNFGVLAKPLETAGAK